MSSIELRGLETRRPGIGKSPEERKRERIVGSTRRKRADWGKVGSVLACFSAAFGFLSRFDAFVRRGKEAPCGRDIRFFRLDVGDEAGEGLATVEKRRVRWSWVELILWFAIRGGDRRPANGLI